MTLTSPGIWLGAAGSARQQRGLRGGGGALGAWGRSLSASRGPSSAGRRVQASGYCTAAPPPRYDSDQPLACVAGAAVRGSGSRAWKRRTRAGKARAERHPSPRAPRGGRPRARMLAGGLQVPPPVQRPGPRVRSACRPTGPPTRDLPHLNPSWGFSGTSPAFRCVSERPAVSCCVSGGRPWLRDRFIL